MAEAVPGRAETVPAKPPTHRLVTEGVARASAARLYERTARQQPGKNKIMHIRHCATQPLGVTIQLQPWQSQQEGA